MTWPTIFASLAAGNQPLALFDTMFTQVAQMVAIPCTATGTNSLTLTPIGSAPTLPGYQNFSSFRYIAPNTSTGLMSAQFTALANLPIYLADGATQASTGANIAGEEYVLVFVQALNGGSGGFFLETAAVASGTTTFAPNIQVFTSGSALTYTTPTAGGRLPLYLRVREAGGGGGGGGATANNGANGTDTSFAGWTALHGIGGGFGQNPGPQGGLGGAGGVNGTGTLIRRMAGNPGGGGSFNSVSGNYGAGMGGISFFGGAGIGGAASIAGGNAAANSGSGGGAGGSSGTGSFGSGGGAGEYVEFIITTPAASYTYTVGTGGNGGAAGGFAGGNGAAGRIEVEAYWQ